MGRVLCISSQTVYGPVGNSAAVPSLQASGHEVMALPTVVLSNHPGHGLPFGHVMPAPLLTQMMQSLVHLGGFDRLDAVMTGYFSNAAQVIAVAKQIEPLAKQNQALHVLVDPVIGDHGKLYVAEDVAEAIRDHLLPLATITTPNRFELSWLSGISNSDDAVRHLNRHETIVTSARVDADSVRTQLHVMATIAEHTTPRYAHVPHGTGDFLAGCYLAHRMTMAPADAFHAAMARVDEAIFKSAGAQALVLS
jgi:pyridoxine kinase